MSGFPIPADALDDRLAILGTSGSGKTYLTTTAMERLLKMQARVVGIDPLGVMWGLRLKADGKTPSGFNIPIFGGSHGDLPLTEHAGALIGETVAAMRESCIVDLSDLPTKAAERRFMTAFLESLYRHTNPSNGDPYHLIIDEADRFAPQKPPAGDETMLNRMEEIVRRGRVKGFIPWLITQRPAVLNKNVLSQADGLILLKLTSSQDRDQVGAWIEGQADRAKGKEILGALPAMQLGQGTIWIPGRGILETAQFPKKSTFDSSRAPKRGEKRNAATLKPLNIDALKGKLAKVEAETKENDPKALKAEIVKLKADLARKPANIAAPSAKDEAGALKDREAAFAAGVRGGRETAYPEGWLVGERTGFTRGVSAAHNEMNAALGHVAAVAYVAGNPPKMPSKQPTSPSSAHFAPTKPVISRAPAVGATKIGLTPKTDTGLPGPQQRILNSLATWSNMDHVAPSNAQVAWLARYSPSSTSYTNPRSALASNGLVEYPMPDCVGITSAGGELATPIDIPGTLLDFVLALIPGPEARILQAAASFYPNPASNDEVAAGANYSASSTSYTNPRSALKSKDLITYPSNGQVRAADWLFEEPNR